MFLMRGVPPHPTAAPSSLMISRWHAGGDGSRSEALDLSPGPAPEAGAGASVAASFILISTFSLLFACDALDALAPKRATNASRRAISSCSALAAAIACSSLCFRCSMKEA